MRECLSIPILAIKVYDHVLYLLYVDYAGREKVHVQIRLNLRLASIIQKKGHCDY